MDPVRTEIMRNRFAAIAEEASNVAYRTAYTTFVKQTQDYQVAMASAEGAFFAYPMKAGVTSSVCQNVRGLVDEIGIDTLVPGDIILTNDPFSGDALCTHTMDIHLLRPVFRDGRVIAFGWAFIHASDIGGAVPGSIAPTSYEVFQEGVRLRPGLLYRAGVLNEPLWHFFADNSRIPDLIWGDLQAMMAGLALLDTRLQELCDRYTTEGVLGSIADVLDLGEIKARAALSRLTPGRYEFSDYLEAYQGDGHVFIHAAMTVEQGGTVAMDFTGSDPAVRLAMNFVTGSRAHPFLCMPLINFIQTMEPTTPVNGGIIRPIRTFAPVGTLMNAEFPAAMGNRWVAVMRCYDVILGCLNQAFPGGSPPAAPARPASSRSPASMAAPAAATSRWWSRSSAAAAAGGTPTGSTASTSRSPSCAPPPPRWSRPRPSSCSAASATSRAAPPPAVIAAAMPCASSWRTAASRPPSPSAASTGSASSPTAWRAAPAAVPAARC